MSDKTEKLEKWQALLDEEIHEGIREQSERYRRAGVNTSMRAVIDQVFEQTEEKLLRQEDRRAEDGLSGSSPVIKQILRLPEFRKKFYTRYGC